MLSFFRKALSSWVVLALLGLLLVAFVVTGVGDPFGGGGGPAPGSLVKVGKDNVTEAEFRQQFDRMLQRAREQNPTATAEQAARQGVVEQLVEQLAASSALEQFGRKQGLGFGEEAVDREIASIPAFQIAGRFDQGTYEQALAAQRLTDRELRDTIRGDAIRRQLLIPVGYGTKAPTALAEPYASLLLEARKGAIGTVSVARITDIPAPTDAQINAYYQANIRKYTLPERRAFRYAILNKADVASRVAISDADIKRYYDEHQDVYGSVEQRQLSQVVVQDQAVAQRIATQAKAGQPFADVAAKQAGYSAADLALGTLNQAKLAQTTSADIARAAFAAPSGGIVGPLKSDFGWHVLHVDSVVPGKSRSLAEVRDEIVTTLRAERAEDQLSDQVAQIEDALTEGQSFADVTGAHKLTAVQVPPVTRTGQTTDRSSFQLPPQATPLVARAFETSPGDEPTVQELGEDTFAVLEVTDVVQPTPVPLAQIRTAVAADWLRDQKQAKAKAVADAIVAEVKKGTPLAQALAKRGLPAPQPYSGRRIETAQGGRVPPPLALMFSLPQGSVRALAGPNNLGYFIVKVDEVTPGDPKGNPQLLQITHAQIGQNVGDELLTQFARAVAAEVGVKRDAKAIAQIKARYLGQTPAADE